MCWKTQHTTCFRGTVIHNNKNDFYLQQPFFLRDTWSLKIFDSHKPVFSPKTSYWSHNFPQGVKRLTTQALQRANLFKTKVQLTGIRYLLFSRVFSSCSAWCLYQSSSSFLAFCLHSSFALSSASSASAPRSPENAREVETKPKITYLFDWTKDKNSTKTR